MTGDQKIQITLASTAAAAIATEDQYKPEALDPVTAAELAQVKATAFKGIGISRMVGEEDGYPWPLHISPVWLIKVINELEIRRSQYDRGERIQKEDPGSL